MTSIIGDSILTGVYGTDIANELQDEQMVVVKPFTGARTQCMNHYIQPAIKLDPDRIIIHCGTNNLKTEETPELIGSNIIGLANLVRNSGGKTQVVISGILPRNDQFNEKGKAVNNIVKNLCQNSNIPFICHENLDPTQNTTRKGIHLNFKGKKKLICNFTKFLGNG